MPDTIRSQAAMVVPTSFMFDVVEDDAGEGDQRGKCADGVMTTHDIAKAAGCSVGVVVRAIAAHLGREREPGQTGVTFELDGETVPNPLTRTRAQMGRIVAERLGVGRYAPRRRARESVAARESKPKKERRVSAQQHPWKMGDRGRSLTNTTGGIIATLACGCGATEQVRFRQLCDGGVMDRKFKEKGWLVNPGRCPACTRPKRQESTMTKHTPASAQATARMFGLLTAEFDTENGCYSAGWSDEKIATETGLARDYVATVREEAFGPLKEPAETVALAQDIEALAQMLAEHEQAAASIRTELDRLKARHQDLRQRFMR